MTKDIRDIPLAEIIFDPEIQQREKLDDSTVGEYAAILSDPEQGPATFPPCIVFEGADGMLAADGFHRGAAAKQVGLETLRCEVIQGGFEDALYFALGANKAHGLNRTAGDKAKVVNTAMTRLAGRFTSDCDIARHTGIPRSTVQRHRSSLAQWASEESGRRTYTTKHGTVSTMDTTRIGKGRRDESGDSEADLPVGEDMDPGDRDAERLASLRNGETAEEPTSRARGGKSSRVTHEADPAEVTEDGNGDPIPATLRGLFADTTLADAADTIDRWLDMLLPRLIMDPIIAKHKAFPFCRQLDLHIDLETAHDSLVKALERVRAGLPHAVCPSCGGSRCSDCRSAGYVPRWRWEELK